MYSNFFIFLTSYVLILLSVTGYGFLIVRAFPKFNITNNLGYIGLIGIFFLCIYSFTTSIFIKHDYIHNSVLIVIGFLSFFYFSSVFNKKNKKKLLYFLIVFSLLLFASFIFKMHDDFPYYHFKYSYILTQNNIVFGLGHLNLGFRTPSSIFFLNSIFYLPIVKFYMFSMPAILIMGFTNLIIFEKINNNLENNQVNYITFFSILSLLFINIFFYRIAEHGTDKSAQILIFLLIIEILIFLDTKTLKENTLSKIYLLIGLVVSLKAFYVLYLILFFLLFFKVLSQKEISKSILFLIKNSFFLPVFYFFVLIIGTYFITTGCLIYPVSFTCFENFSWSLSKFEVLRLNEHYEAWSKAGRTPNYKVENISEYISYFNWVNVWIKEYFFNKISDFLLGLIFLLLVTFFIFFSSKKKNLEKKKSNFIIPILLLLLFEWFYNHPALRYGGYCLIAGIIFLLISKRLELFDNNLDKIKKKFQILILITILIFLSRNLSRIFYEIEFYSYKPLTGTYYMFDNNYFDIPERLKNKIDIYNTCQITNNVCSFKDNIEIKKIFYNYILFRSK